ncbi:MAG: beta-ketoacyl-ACP synthase II [Candidatus Saganbacteria bacterium]|nr:beta-ketoacyl-ACP synthase II [Candidatus Saganbacteria bacterium]
MSDQKKVVVTGIGAVTPVGLGKDAFWEALKAGTSGIRRITHFDPAAFDCQIAGELKGFDPSAYLDKKEARRLVRFIQFAVAASQMALKDANLEINPDTAPSIGVIIGSGIGGIQFLEEQAHILKEKGPGKTSPFMVPLMINDMAAGMVSVNTGAKGPNSCVTTACASGTNAIGDAYEIIRRGEAAAMISGGTEASITPLGIAGFCAAQALSCRNDSPETASRPFDKERDGFVMGEGSGIVILEELEHAKKRGATIYAEVIGYGMSGDAYHMTAPAADGNGAIRAMKAALKSARLSPDKIDYINAHGTSTQMNDKIETLAIKDVFGDHARKVAISSTKSMVGHLLGAAGAVEFAASVLSIKHSFVHPTINYSVPDPECDLDYVPNKGREMKVNVIMSNSFGFGGHNAILIARKFNG